MGYQSLYLKYRPQVLADVIGQDHVCRTLRNALTDGKVAHAYLFAGPRGTGKTTTARILAKALCCTRADGPTPDPCGECAACAGIRDGSLLDVVELDAASNRGIDEVRDLKEIITYQPTWARYKIFIIDEVHQMTKEAFNALLKTLEEPPPHAFFVLATTDPQKVPVTILSRCQRFDFRRVATPSISALLRRIAVSEGFQAEDAALATIARLADGCVRDAITTLDQVVAYTGGAVTASAVTDVVGGPGFDLLFRLSDLLARRDSAGAFEFVDSLTREGRSYVQVLEAAVTHLRNILVARLGAASEESLEADAATVERYREEARRFDEPYLALAMREIGRALDEMRWNGQHRIVTELALASITGAFGSTGPPRSPPPAAEANAKPSTVVAEEAPTAPFAASPAPPTASSEWQRAVLAIIEARPALGAFLRETTATVHGGELVVAFASGFHCDSFSRCLAGEDSREDVLNAVAKAYGRELRVRAVMAEPATPGERGSGTEERSTLDMVLDLFEGSEPIDG